MILDGISELRKLLPSINLRDDSHRLDDFAARAQAWVTDNIIGTELEELLEIEIEGNDPHPRLRLLVKRVIADKAYLTVGDEMNLQLGEAGMVVQNNQSMSAASSQRRDNLMASLRERLDTDCDALVNYLTAHSVDRGETDALYPDWRGTEQYAYMAMAFMPTLGEVRRHVPQGLDYKPHWETMHNWRMGMSTAMMDLAASYVSTAEIIRLRELYRDNDLNGVQREAIERLRDVAVCLAVGDRQRATQAAIRAREVMLGSLDDFTEFAASSCVNLSGVDFDAGHIVDTI